ncbi:hypothetical protein CROQUDRAFT_100841 [Cronartium quercuum f. sp. fusiforme G11]|uniref:Uncharacterized protein n=1 Tax=Cronartium quercuum f. sp. fusiforme G11 TaxID=708437 RepID=A0A9P6N9S2_9BASI|nr:hypothetical protein CROQUDRAFT_100841 [Cronartium quercuum f. sp. fusiforme G11]
MLKDKHGKQAKFNPLSIPSPKVRVHTINGVAEMDPDDVPLTHSQLRRLMRKKGTVSFTVHVQEHLNSVSETTGPREDVPPELPQISSQDLHLREAASHLLTKFSCLFDKATIAIISG